MRSWYWPGFFRILQFLAPTDPHMSHAPKYLHRPAPVQIQEVPCRIRNSEVQILRKGLHAAPRVRPVRLQT